MLFSPNEGTGFRTEMGGGGEHERPRMNFYSLLCSKIRKISGWGKETGAGQGGQNFHYC